MSWGATRSSRDLIGKNGQQPPPAGSPRTHPPLQRLPSPDVMWGSRSPGTGTEQKAMSNASASPTQGVSCSNGGFLTPWASTSPPREGSGWKTEQLSGQQLHEPTKRPAHRGEGTFTGALPMRGASDPIHCASWCPRLELPLLTFAQSTGNRC